MEVTVTVLRRFFLHILLICFYGLLFMQCYNLIATHIWWPYASVLQGVEYLSMNVVAIGIAYAVNYWVVFGRRLRKGISPMVRLLIDIVLSYSLMLITTIPFLYLMASVASGSSYIDWIGASFYNAFCLLGMEVVFFIRQYTLQIKTANATKEMLLKYQYDALRAQVNPHFLFNSLNIIQALANEDPERATKAIQCLSDIYRYVLDKSMLESVSLCDEWKNALSYMELVRFRYEDSVDIQVEGKPCDSAEIVPMTLQILLENVFKHNVVSRSKVMSVHIVFGEEDVRVRNAIRRKFNSRSTEFGLRYLQNLYIGQGKTLKIEDDGSMFTVIVPYFLTSESAQDGDC